ncbi:MAG: Gfo/Idh/MocA family oxidoreductase [Gammaproteobacteria bacterium]|nr:Gfo/Idh/MocA family oxidoreductase [Gammaproteobacteria bacterium]
MSNESVATPTLGVAIIGVGMVSKTYLDAISKTQLPIKLTGALGSSADSSQRFIESNRLDKEIIAAYKDIEALLADNSVDFVCLNTPPNARIELVDALISAGKPILMEKPIERSLASARQLVEACQSANLPLGIMLQHRARPSATLLKRKLNEESFGELRAAEICVPWWREQSYYDEPGRGSYERDGGGVMISQAIHTLDLALQFTGDVETVSAFSATTKFHQMEAEDFVNGGLRFINGAVGTAFMSTASFPGRTESIHLHYENVSVQLESNLLTLSWHDGRTETLGESAASGAGADPMAFTSDWHRFMIENFYEVVLGNAEPIASAESALQVHRVIDALERSAHSGTPANI